MHLLMNMNTPPKDSRISGAIEGPRAIHSSLLVKVHTVLKIVLSGSAITVVGPARHRQRRHWKLLR